MHASKTHESPHNNDDPVVSVVQWLQEFRLHMKLWVRLSIEANILEFNSICAISGRRRFHQQRGICDDFVNLEDLPTHSSKMLIEIGFALLHSYG